MKTEGLLPCSYEPACPYSEPYASVRTFIHYFMKIHSNIIFPSTPRSSEWSPPFRFSNQNVCRI